VHVNVVVVGGVLVVMRMLMVMAFACQRDHR
jgi:hypothetical protein